MDRILTAAALAAALAMTAPAHAGDADAGQEAFATYCSDCHSVASEMTNRKGPTLFGLIGRKAGSVPGYEYSEANAASGWVWDDDVLRRYLPNPRAAMPGTKMKFDGVTDPDEVEDIIAFLETRK